MSKELLEKHECLSQEARVQVVKLVPVHIVDWEEAQEVDAALATCCKWLCLRKYTPLPSEMPSSRSAWEQRLRQNRAYLQ